MAHCVRLHARMSRRRIAIGLSLILSACSNGTSASTTPQPVADSAAPIVDCVGDSVTTDAACGSLSWAQSATTSRPRNHHLSVVAQTSAGRISLWRRSVDNDAPIANVDRAPINSDGTLGDFTALTAIPPRDRRHDGRGRLQRDRVCRWKPRRCRHRPSLQRSHQPPTDRWEPGIQPDP